LLCAVSIKIIIIEDTYSRTDLSTLLIKESVDRVWWCNPAPIWQSQTSQHCILACTARIIGWCAVNWEDLALSLSLYKRVSWANQVVPDGT